MKKALGLLLSILMCLILGLVGKGDPVYGQSQDFGGIKVSLGVASDDEEAVWQYVAQKAKEEGIILEITLFTDAVRANYAVADGSLDLNAFQHIAHLNAWNEENDEDLQSLGYTYVSPLALYSDRYQSLENLPDGAVIAIPNDPTNTGRALLLLELAGLIEVDDAAGVLPTPHDVTQNDKGLVFKELESAQIFASLQDVDGGVLVTNYALDNGLSPQEDGLFVDTDQLDQVNEDYKNILVAAQDQVDNPAFKRLIDLYQTDEVAEQIKTITKGANVPAW